jgi:hypothetical protein
VGVRVSESVFGLALFKIVTGVEIKKNWKQTTDKFVYQFQKGFQKFKKSKTELKKGPLKIQKA